MAKKRALGRGLSALLENADKVSKPKPIEKGAIGNVAGSIAMLKLSHIEANPFQPRNNFKKTPLEELSSSIKEHGIIQPVTVRQIANSRYQLISGERRFRASQLAGLKEIPAYIRKADDQTMLEMALVENIQREDLDAIEVAISYQRLIEECNLTQEMLSEKVGKNRSTVTNYLRLLKLPAEIQIGIIEKEITMGHARALVSAGSSEKQISLFNKIVKEGLSVRQVENLNKVNQTSTNTPTKSTSLSADQKRIDDVLKTKFGPKSVLKVNSAKAGKIEIPFSSKQELERISKLLNL